MSPWSRKSNTSTCLWSQDSFSVFTDDNAGGRWQFLYHTSYFRFQVLCNYVSAPKLLPLISVTYPMDPRKALTVLYNELCHHLWDSLAPSECLALWQCQQLNTSVCHASSVVDTFGAQVTTCQHLSCHCWKPCTISACFHGITHTPYTFTKWQWIFIGATHTTYKNQNTLHTSKSAMDPEDHLSLIWHTYVIHSQLYNDTIYKCWLHA